MDVTCALDYPSIPAGHGRKLHVLVRIETWPEEGGSERKPLNVSLVIDRSGSMSGEPMERTKEAALSLLSRLSPEDVLSVVTYSDSAEVVLSPTPAADKDVIGAALRQIRTGGMTNLSGGWLLGLSLLAEREGQDFLHRVLVLTDGKANEGVTDLEGLNDIARQHQARGLTTTTIGFGTSFNEQLLTDVAREGGGRFHYVRSPDEAPTVFVDEFGDLARVFGQNLEVRVEAMVGEAAPEILGGLASRAEGATAIVSLGDIRDRDRKEVLAALRAPSDLKEGSVDLAAVQVIYDAVRGKVGRRVHAVPVKIDVKPETEADVPRDPEVALEITLHEVASLKHAAIRSMDEGDINGARGHLNRALQLVSVDGDGAPPADSPAREVFERQAQGIRDILERLGAIRSHAGPASPTQREQMRDARITMHSQVMPSAVLHQRLDGRRPDVDVQSYKLSPDRREVLEDIVDAVKETLGRFSHTDEFVGNAQMILRELVDNALEHGCKGADKPEVEVETRCSRSYFKTIIEDNGPGFNAEEVLRRAEEKAGDAEHKRGRGLLMVKRVAQSLEFSDSGNIVTAMLARERFDVGVRETIALNRDGVGKVAVVTVEGNLDSHTTRQFESALSAAGKEGIGGLIIDVTNCDYISSSGLGAIVGACMDAERRGGSVVIAGAQSAVRKVFQLMGIESIVRLAETVDDARKMLEG